MANKGNDVAAHSTHTILRKFYGDWTAEGIAEGLAGDPYEVIESDGNMLITAGILVMLTGLIGGAITPYSAANARIGIGDSTTAAAASQTDLQAAANKVRVAMDAGWPKLGVAGGLNDNQVQFQSTMGAGVAEWAGGWQEFAVFNAAAAGAMFNRKVENKGVKAAGTTWQFQVTVTIT